MLKQYIISALRNIARQKIHFLINFIGLTIGLTSCLLILFYVIDELSFDRFHEKGKRIYRIGYSGITLNGDPYKYGKSEYRYKDELENYFTQAEHFVRISDPGMELIKIGSKEYWERNISLVDKDFFKVFSFECIGGNIENALDDPFSVVIAENLAKKLFNNVDIVGQDITIATRTGDHQFTIKGIIKDMPSNSHFRLNMLISLETAPYMVGNMKIENWGEMFGFTYMLLPEYTQINSFKAISKEFVRKTFGNKRAEDGLDVYFQPLYEIHLQADKRDEIQKSGNKKNVIIFSIVALFILFLATINYMNLSTARYERRSKEVGIKKILGARKMNLITQFLYESIFICFLAVLFSLAFADLLLPKFNTLAGKEINIDWLNNIGTLMLIILFSVIIGILSGSYPAFFLSSFKPLHIIKGANQVDKGSLMRKILVISQFTVSIGLIICTLVILNQWRYMQNKPLGINTENIVLLQSPGSNNYFRLKEELLKYPDIISITGSNKKPTGKLSSNLTFRIDGDESRKVRFKILAVDFDFFKTLENQIVQGRSFNKSNANDLNSTFILNQTAVKAIGWEDALGKNFEAYTYSQEVMNWVSRFGTVVGVAEDFHFESVHNSIVPVVFFIDHLWRNWMIIKIRPDNIPETMSYIEKEWNNLDTEMLYYPTIYDDELSLLYKAEKSFFTLFVVFALLAILIACLGIFGLASFTAEQRTKEIGIRKVMGSSVFSILGLINREFLRLVLFSNILAWPVAWYFMKRWLENFSYRIDLTVWPFIISAIIAFFVALITVSFQTFKAASTQPVVALRYE